MMKTFLVNKVLAAGLDTGFNNVNTIQGKSGVKNFGSISDVIMAVLKAGLAIFPIIALVAIIVAGVMYIAALGDEKKTERAKLVILYTVIGIVVVGLAGILTNVVINLITKG